MADPTLADGDPTVNVEIEQALLGCLLVNNKTYFEIAETVRPEDFSEAAHARIFDVIARTIEAGKPASPVSLNHIFADEDTLADVEGSKYLARLAGAAVNTWSAVHYADTVRRLALRRAVIKTAGELADNIEQLPFDAPASEPIEVAERQLSRLADRGAEKDLANYHEAANRALDQFEKAMNGEDAALTTGLPSLDRALSGGMHNSDLIILAGRSGMGKTGLAVNIAEATAKAHAVNPDDPRGAPVGIFSLEMTDDQLAARSIARESKVNVTQLRQGRMSKEQWSTVVQAAHTVGRLPIVVDDRAGLTIRQICTRARLMKRTHDVGLIILDHLGQIRLPGRVNRVHELEYAIQELKRLAKELDIPVLVLSQLSRQVEQRDDKRPVLSDLRDSGAVEQEADQVGFVYRDEYYLEGKEPDPRDGNKHLEWQSRMDDVRDKADIFLRKNRHGATASLKFRFDRRHMDWRELGDEPGQVEALL